MQRLRFKIAIFLLPILALILLDASQGTAQAIRLGYLKNDLHQLACFIALTKGYFSDEGLQVEVAGVFNAGPEEMSAFAAGELDVGYVGAAPATVAVANGTAAVKIIAQVNLEGSAIVTGQGSGLHGLPGLIGKMVAVPGYATVQDFLFRKACKAANISLKSVNIIVLKPPEMIPALRGKQIDAFVAWEPYPAKAVTLGVGEILRYSRDIWPGHPCCALVAASGFLEAHPAAMEKILKAHVKATDFILTNFEEAAAIGAEYTGMDLATVKLAMQHIAYQYELNIPGELEYVEFLNELGVIKVKNPSAFVDRIIAPEYLRKVLPKQ